MITPLDIIKKGNKAEILALFRFNLSEPDEVILVRFGLWARYFFPKYFKYEDAPFHKQMDLNNLRSYRGDIKSFLDIAFRGCGKTTRAKLFISFCVLNDKNTHRKYIKVLSKDINNSKQWVTDIYNMLVVSRVREFYPNTFEKSELKREETMSAFTTSFGVKLRAGTVGMDQRGALQEEARPDWIIHDDFETRNTLRSAVETKTIWDNMEEAKNSLPPDGSGSCIYLCNYLSERGNVHKLVLKENERNVLLTVPIIKDGVPTWFHDVKYIEQLQQDVDDFEGEYLCQPSAGKDIMFDREVLDNMTKRLPVQTIAGFKMFKKYDPSHRYGSGADVAGGVGLDSSTNVIINFDLIPAQVAATYRNNEIKPDIFGDELKRQNEYYNNCLVAPEKNNHGHATIGRLKQIYKNIFETPQKETSNQHEREYTSKEYGWHTNMLTKPKMFADLVKAVNDGLLVLNDPDLIMEARSYTRNDLMDREVDVRLTTRHFDLLTACAIAWQMRNHVGPSEQKKSLRHEIHRFVENKDFDPFEVV